MQGKERVQMLMSGYADFMFYKKKNIYLPTLKSWKSQGVTSLEGNGDRGLDPPGEVGRPSLLIVCTELLRSLCERDDDDWSRCPVVRTLNSDPLDDSWPSSPRKFEIFL